MLVCSVVCHKYNNNSNSKYNNINICKYNRTAILHCGNIIQKEFN